MTNLVKNFRDEVTVFGHKASDLTSNDLTHDEKINKLETIMLDMPQAECSVTHHFGPGICMREVTIPAGTVAIGHHQNFDHLNYFVKGKVLMLSDDGTTKELTAPMIFTGQPGRKIGYIIEDMVWQNIYPTDETDIDKIEATFITKSEEWINSVEGKESLLKLEHSKDRIDYNLVLEEFNISHEIAKEQSENKEDQIVLPDGTYKFKVSKSNIQGLGLIATANIDKNELIAPARIDGKRTPAGRFTNHSSAPNAKMVEKPNGDIDLVSIAIINGCKGGLDGDEITIDYRQALLIQLKGGTR